MAHEHILNRLYPERITETKEAPEKAKIKQALTEIKAAAKSLPLQAAMDVCSAVMDIEDALAK